MSAILDKIEKLFALAQNNDNPHQAAAAMAKAQALMAEHNLTLGTLERHKIGEIAIKSTQSVSKVKDWELWIVDSVARAFGCRIMWRSGNSYAKDPFGRFILVGPKVGLELAEYAAVFLLRKVVEGRRELNLRLPGGWSRQAKTKELDGFCKGYASTVWHKVLPLVHPEQMEAAIEAYVKETATAGETNVQKREAGLEGYRMGVEAGNATDLNRPMNAGEAQLQLQGK